MGLQSALSTALTGLTAAETTIDVVGNNLANSNTVGFKASQASFATQFLQTLSLGSAPTDNTGGTNPRQIGLGTLVADITPNFNQGTLEISSNPTDLAIQGEGFFVVEGDQGERLYTRNGIFKFNAANEIVTITGNRVLGFGVDDRFQIQRTALVPIQIPLGGTAVAQATENVFLEGTLSPTGDLADTAERIQTGILGDGQYAAPTAPASVDFALAPNVVGAVTTGTSQPGGGMTGGDTYEYRFVWQSPDSLAGLDESVPSDVVTATVNPADGSIDLSNVPVDPVPSVADGGPYTTIRIYRRNAAGPAEFRYIDEIPWDAGTYLDTMSDVAASTQPILNETVLTGNYRYYVTFASAPGGPGSGIESRPAELSDPVNVTNGRVLVDDIPADGPLEPRSRYVASPADLPP